MQTELCKFALTRRNAPVLRRCLMRKKSLFERRKKFHLRALQRDVKICLSNSINAQQDLLRDEAKSASHQMIMKVM